DIDASIREQVRVRFLAEEKITRAIRHPYVVHIRETSPADARPCFLAMDFVAGRPFSQHLARLRQGDGGASKPSRADYLAEVARLGHQVASAMSAAHAQGIVHRDLKPQNVLVCCEHSGQLAEVRIVDFGIAKAPVELFSVAAATSVTRYWTELGTVMGSPPCMAPEQCGAAQTVTGKADVFALGVMLFGSVLGVDIEQLEARAAHLKLPEDLENSLALRGPLPGDWQALLRGMLESDPALRPEMHDVALRLQRLARADVAFAVAVEAWVRHRRVPGVRKLVGFLKTADTARYLTEDERRFLKLAPLQKLRGLQKRLLLSWAFAALALAGLVVLGVGSRVLGGDAVPLLASSAGERKSLPGTAASADESVRSALDAQMRELREQLETSAQQAREQQRSIAERQRELDTLRPKLAHCEQRSKELAARSEELSERAERQRALLERCDGESERLLSCRQESAVKSRELAETTQ